MAKRQVLTRFVLLAVAWLAVGAALSYALAALSPVLGGLAGGAFVIVLLLTAWASFTPNARLWGPIVTGEGAGPRVVALTFDDGPSPDTTPRILDALAREGVRATFFVLGRQAERHPEVVRRARADGHEIASHGYDHGLLTFAGPRAISDQLERTERALDDGTGAPPARLFRAPHGFRNPFVSKVARQRDYELVGWTKGVWDTATPGVDKIVDRSARGLRPGAILLLHDADGADAGGDRSQTAEAVPAIVQAAREQGYEFVTVGELAKLAPPRELATRRLLIGVLVLGVLAALAARQLRLGTVTQINIAWWWVLVSLAANLVSIVLKAVVWKAALDAVPGDVRVRLRQIVPALFIGFLLNTLLFARVGEIARVSVLRRRLRIDGMDMPVATIAGTVLSEQIVLGIALAAMFLVMPFVLSVPGALLHLLVAFLIAIFVIAVAFVGLEAWSRARRRRHPAYPDLARTRWQAMLQQGERVLHGMTEGQQLVRHPRLAVWALANGVVSWLAQLFGIYAALRAFDIQASVGMSALVFLSSTLVQLFPILPANIGLFQAGVVLPLERFYNVDFQHALAFSIGLQLIEAALGVGLGFVFLSREGLSLAEARSLPEDG